MDETGIPCRLASMFYVQFCLNLLLWVIKPTFLVRYPFFSKTGCFTNHNSRLYRGFHLIQACLFSGTYYRNCMRSQLGATQVTRVLLIHAHCCFLFCEIDLITLNANCFALGQENTSNKEDMAIALNSSVGTSPWTEAASKKKCNNWSLHAMKAP